MKSILLISHTTQYPGPVHKFYDYLIKNYNVYMILHPLFLDSSLTSSIQFNNRKIIFKIYPLLQYLLEGLFSLFYFRQIYTKKPKIDLAICFDPLCFIHMYIFKRFFGIKKIVYYNIDYSKHRFVNSIMNFIYNKSNIFSYKKCDYFWGITKKFTEDIDPKGIYAYKNFIVSHIVKTTKNINRIEKQNNRIIYAGSLDYTVDLVPLFTALKKLKQKNILFSLDIFGFERTKGKLKKMITSYDLQKYVFFKGLIDNKSLQNILPTYKIGVAPYVTKKNNLFPDHAFAGSDLSLKLVEYIAAGLPIITIKLQNGFTVIEKNQFGFLVKNVQEWQSAILKLLKDRTLYLRYKKNALQYANKYNEEKVLRPIFDKIL